MEQFSSFIGIDVSKLWLDVAVLRPTQGIIHQKRIDNNRTCIRALLKDLKKLLGTEAGRVLFCLEHTGRYGDAFLAVSAAQGANVWVEQPLQIKRSQGLVRGKTDAWDAVRIAEYACRFADRAALWKPVDATVAELKGLQVKRARLVKARAQLVQENRSDPFFRKPVEALGQAVLAIELKMEELVRQSQEAARQFALLNTVPGIGKQTAIALIVATQGFTRLTTTRKLSCYAGMAPFPYSSGSSVRGSSRISRMGNMKLKVMMNLSAWNAIRSVAELREYYQKKVGQGKNKMSVINAVRNKLIAMALSVIRRNTPFEKKYSCVFA